MWLLDTLRLPPEDERYREELETAVAGEFFRRSQPALLFLFPILFILQRVIVEAYTLRAEVRWVFWAIVMLTALRWVALRSVRSASTRTRLRVGVATAVATSAGFALLNLTVVPWLLPANAALMTVIATGINSVALVSLAGTMVGYLLYMGLNLGSMAVAVARSQPTLSPLLPVLLVIYIAVLALMGISVHLGLRKQLLLGLKLRDLALRDTLTQLRNRRYLTEFLDDDTRQRGGGPVDAARRRPPPAPPSLGLFVIDLDHFKTVNDEHGHNVGDEVLRHVARLLEAGVRGEDLVARWGGEEFVVVARCAQREGLQDMAERLRASVEANPARLSTGLLRCTCSIGYAPFPFSAEHPIVLSWQQVLRLADGALYQAKAGGRNRCVGVLPAPEVGEAALRALPLDGDDGRLLPTGLLLFVG